MLQANRNQRKCKESGNLIPTDPWALRDYINTNIQGKARSALRYVIALGNRFPSIYASQSRIAHKISACRATANRVMGKLHSLGLVTKTYRYKQTCIYRLHTSFYDPEVRRVVGPLLNSLFFLSVAYLYVAGVQYPQTEKCPYIFGNRNLQHEMLHKDIIEDYNNPSLVPSLSGGQGDKDQKKYSAVRRDPVITGPKVLIGLNLTRLGEIKLQAFPPEALAHALKELKVRKGGKIGDYFGFFFGLCLKYCQEHDIRPRYKEMFLQIESEGLDKYGETYNRKDPLVWKAVEAKQSITPRIPEQKVSPHSIYATARPPQQRQEETEEQKQKGLESLIKSASQGNPFAAILANAILSAKPKP